MTDAEFSKLSGQLLAAIHSSVHQKEVAGNLTNLSDSEVAKWQPTRDSVQWANYQINSVRAYADTAMRRPVGKEVGNPLLLAYTTLALLLINRRRYSTSPDPLALHVSITEMDAIKKVVSEIDEANKALAPLQDPVLYLTLFSYIKASAQAFGNAYEDEIKAFQTEKAGELDLDTAKARTKKHELDIKQFKSQKIEPNWKGGEARYEWFRAEHKVSDGSFSNTCVPSLNQGMGECTAGKSMSELKAYVTRMENEFKASTNEYADLGANIAYPAEDYPGKLLPIPPSLVEKIVNTLPKNIQHAVELNQLQLRFQYVIKNEATEVKVKKDNLSSSGWFRSLREPSKPKFHLQLWIENRLCYSVSFPYSMPIHTPGESEWLYWVGGTRPMGGVKCVGFGSGSHRNCSWTQQIYMPIIEHHAGYIKTFDPNSTKSAASQIDIEVIAKIANQRITQQYDILRTEFNTFIRPKVETDYKSELGKRITAFEANIKRLKALLALAFPEIHSHNHVLYRAMYESDVPLSRESFLSYLENNPSLLGNEVFVPLEKFITKLEEQVIKAVNSLKLTAANPLLALASTELQDWIKEFGPTAVESNKIAPCPVGKEPHDALRQQMQRNSQLEVVLMGLARTVNGLSPELAQSILEETRRNIGDIVSANPHVLGDETTPPDSVARLLVVSSPLFTSPGPQPALPPPAPKGPNNP